MMPISIASEKGRAAEHQQGDHHDGRHDLRHDGSRERLIDRLIEHLIRREPATHVEALPDPVEDDDRVVERIADDRENRRHDRKIEGRAVEGEDTEHQDRVVDDGDDGAEREPPSVEAERDVDEDHPERERQGPCGAALELAPDLRSDDIETANLRVGIHLLQHRLDLGADLGAVHLARRQPDLDVARRPEVLNLGVIEACRGELTPHGVRVRSVGERRLDRDTAREVDREIEPPGRERHDRDDHENDRQPVPHLACGHEREAGRLVKEFHLYCSGAAVRSAAGRSCAGLHRAA